MKNKYEVNIYNKIKEKFEKAQCSKMWANQKEFLNGIIRKFKPKKILEIGVRHGGRSIKFYIENCNIKCYK